MIQIAGIKIQTTSILAIHESGIYIEKNNLFINRIVPILINPVFIVYISGNK